MSKDILKLISRVPVHTAYGNKVLILLWQFLSFLVDRPWDMITHHLQTKAGCIQTWTNVRNWQTYTASSWQHWCIYICVIFATSGVSSCRDTSKSQCSSGGSCHINVCVHLLIGDTSLTVKKRICHHRMKRSSCTGAWDKSWSGLYNSWWTFHLITQGLFVVQSKS